MASGNTTVTVPCRPFLQPGQQVFLIIGDQQAAADLFTSRNEFAVVHLSQSAADERSRARCGCASTGSRAASSTCTTTPPAFTGPTMTVTDDDDETRTPIRRSWFEQNQAYLSAEFARLRHRLASSTRDEAKTPSWRRIAATLR